MGDGGKGSSPRPYSVDQKTFSDNWDAIFGKKKKPSTEDNQKKENNERTLDREVQAPDS